MRGCRCGESQCGCSPLLRTRAAPGGWAGGWGGVGGGGACTCDVRARDGMVIEGLSLHLKRRGGVIEGLSMHFERQGGVIEGWVWRGGGVLAHSM